MLLQAPAVSSSSPLQRAVIGSALISLSGVWVALADLPATSSAFFRCAYALPLLWLLARRESRRRIGSMSRDAVLSLHRARTMGLVAGVCFGGDLVFWHAAIDRVGAGMATILAAGQVVVVPLAAWMLLGERPPRRVVVAIPVLLGGIAVVSGITDPGSAGSEQMVGTLLGLGAAVCYSGFLIALRQATAGGSRPAGALRDATAAGATVTLMMTLAGGNATALVPAWPSAGWLLILGVGSQVIAWMLITDSLPRLPSALSSVVLTLQPLLSLLLATVLLGERPSLTQAVGATIVLAAIVHSTGLVSDLAPIGRKPAPVGVG